MTFAPYKDTYNGMWFSLDKEFIQSGKTGQIEENPAGYAKLYKMLRSFPDGIRNCYNLSVEKGRKYLMRATFVYGNYDIKALFDLYLGPNPWDKIDLERVNGTRKGMLHIPTSNSLPTTQWVGFKVKGGDIIEIMDPNKNQNFVIVVVSVASLPIIIITTVLVLVFVFRKKKSYI